MVAAGGLSDAGCCSLHKVAQVAQVAAPQHAHAAARRRSNSGQAVASACCRHRLAAKHRSVACEAALTVPARVLPKLRVLQRDLQQQEGDGVVVQDDPWPAGRGQEGEPHRPWHQQPWGQAGEGGGRLGLSNDAQAARRQLG